MPASLPMVPVWKQIPFLRLLIPLCGGILAGWYLHLHWYYGCVLLALAFVGTIIFRILSLRQQFRFSWLPGIAFGAAGAGMGLLLVPLHLVTNNPRWVGHQQQHQQVLHIRVLEPVVEKEKTFKALAEFRYLQRGDSLLPASGKLMLYFSKKGAPPAVGYGSVLVTQQKPQPIRNAGNPGGFNYQRFALFNGITHQLFLSEQDYFVTAAKERHPLQQWLFTTKTAVLQILQTYIKDPRAVAVAEALLIGYRDHLDRDLVQAYSNTGVVHVIAISGLHLGLIYWLLLLLLKPLGRHPRLQLLQLPIVLLVLWLFSLIAGANASVIRAAIMFSIIAIGTVISRKGNIMNSMAASAFLMLLWNPFLLWDVGFQLSYAAVLSIVLFMQPIFNWMVFPNKLIDQLWQLSAVSIAAQVLTLPLCMYHFHQAPNLFLLSNMVAVPLSSIILFGEILLLAAAVIPPLARLLGALLNQLLQWLNDFIGWLDQFTFAVTDGIMLTPLQTIVLYAFVAACALWLLQKQKRAALWAGACLAAFFAINSYLLLKARQQQLFVVYHLPKFAAADIIQGTQYQFVGDAQLQQDLSLIHI